MFNKSFFLGILTTLVAVCIIGAGVVTAGSAFFGRSVGVGGRSGQFERHFDRGEGLPPGNFAPDGGRFPQRDGPHGGTKFSLWRGLGGIVGSIVILAGIVLAVVAGQAIYRRLSKRGSPPVAPATEFKEPPLEPDVSGPVTPGESPVEEATSPEPENAPAEPPDTEEEE